ncbi:hypothetical protein [Parabacteroides faecis]|uniref:Gpi18-like mannosyltransferase n=1 Tax=Parabacteroides faecis TaxID=1217282 RepID=A0ABR6KNH4_9BACT|nr:hypothetical protein [Parabacteroides faecis]MBB4623071.1 Gpi18-like mannosyltransferase [Parabacteroides faecis]GGJ92683.1 hypothetical protein GCM10007084_15450 [Parabacteroides faecis]
MLKILPVLQSLFRNKKFLALLILAGLLIKLLMLPFFPEPGDYTFFLKPWVEFIRSHGYWQAFRFEFANYSPAYLYFLLGIAKLGGEPLIPIKLVSICFEYVAAWFIGGIAYQKYKEDWVRWCALAVVPLLPTVLINSSYWGQCDSVYASFLVGSIYFVLRKRSFLSILFLGISFSFKLQAILLFPFYFVLLLRNRVKWYYFLLVPAVYLISLLPAYCAGRPLTELLSVFISQSEYYDSLSLQFPNLYMWISDNHYETVKWIGILLTCLFALLTGGLLAKKYRAQLTNDYLVRLALLSAVIFPFLLPGMHERYMYVGDLLAVAYIMYFPRKFYNALGIPLISLFSYALCTSLNESLIRYLGVPVTIFYICVIGLLIRDFYLSSLKEGK